MGKGDKFAVLTMRKQTGESGGLSEHIDRLKYDPVSESMIVFRPDSVIDDSRTHLNRDFIIPDKKLSRTQAIWNRLKEEGFSRSDSKEQSDKKTRKVKKDAVIALCFICSSDEETMKKLEQQGKLDDWAKKTIEWFQNKFDKKNVVSAVMHMDETTPHLHITVVPITREEPKPRKEKPKVDENGNFIKKYETDNNGNIILDDLGRAVVKKKRTYNKQKVTARLSAKDICTPVSLKRWQTEYAAAMKEFGFKRGIEGSKQKHVAPAEYNLQQVQKKIEEEKNRLERTQKDKLQIEEDVKLLKNELKTASEELVDYRQKVSPLDVVKAQFGKDTPVVAQAKKEAKEARSKGYAEGYKKGITDTIEKIMKLQRLKSKEGKPITIEQLAEYNNNIFPRSLKEAAGILQKEGFLPNVQIPSKNFLTAKEFSDLVKEGMKNTQEENKKQLEKAIANNSQELKNQGAREAAFESGLIREEDRYKGIITEKGESKTYNNFSVDDVVELLSKLVNDLKHVNMLSKLEKIYNGKIPTLDELSQENEFLRKQNSELRENIYDLVDKIKSNAKGLLQNIGILLTEVQDETQEIATDTIKFFITGALASGGSSGEGGGGENNQGWRKKDDEDWVEFARRCHSAAKISLSPKTNKNYRGPKR